MVSSTRGERQSVSHRSAALTAIPAVTSIPPSNEALPTTDAAPGLNMGEPSDGRTGIEHRPHGELGDSRSQPYTVWHGGEIVYFCRTKGEAMNVLGRELRKSGVNGAVSDEGATSRGSPGVD